LIVDWGLVPSYKKIQKENIMADSIVTDPFFMLNGQIHSVREKVSDSIFENYKLQVAQTNDINNRAMQVALSTSSSLADLKQATSNGTLQNMLAAARTDAAVGQTSAAVQRSIAEAAFDQQRLTMQQSEITRDLINGLNTQNLNTALINTNTAINGLNGLYGGLGLAYGGAVSAYQSANQVSAINSLGSALASNGIINTGTAANVAQTGTPTSIGT
jgi:hypothetical protein